MLRLFSFLEPVMADAPNYHIQLWPEPPGPPTYLCLLCAVKDCTKPEILAHVPAGHAVEPVPTPLAADASIVPTLLRGEEAADASAHVLDRDDR